MVEDYIVFIPGCFYRYFNKDQKDEAFSYRDELVTALGVPPDTVRINRVVYGFTCTDIFKNGIIVEEVNENGSNY